MFTALPVQHYSANAVTEPNLRNMTVPGTVMFSHHRSNPARTRGVPCWPQEPSPSQERQRPKRGLARWGERSSAEPSVRRMAEVDGNRTRRTRITRPNRFEGGGAHQVLVHLRGGVVQIRRPGRLILFQVAGSTVPVSLIFRLPLDRE